MNKSQLNIVNQTLKATDITFTQSEIEDIIKAVETANPSSPWWVILLKVIAYAIGLVLGGFATTASAATVISIL